MSECGRCRRKPLFVSYHAVCKAIECADKIFAGQNFTPARLHGKKWRGQNFADKRTKFTAAKVISYIGIPHASLNGAAVSSYVETASG